MEDKNLSPHEPVVREGDPTPSNATAEPAAAFTPGPWRQHAYFSARIVPQDHAKRAVGGSVHDAEDERTYAQEICVVHVDRHGRGDATANARLIAAAPDLLAALQACLELIGSEFTDDEAFAFSGHPIDLVARAEWDEGWAAIAKATGADQ